MARRSNAGLFQRLLEAGKRTTYHGKIRTRGGKRTGTVRRGKQTQYKGVRIIPVDGEFETSLDSSRFETTRQAKRFIDAWKKQGNPSIEGVKFSLGRGGVVIWSDNWDQLTKWAEKKQHGFKFRAGGPETYGHTDIVHRSNPRGTKGRFERCVKAVSERGGAVDPKAVCGAQEKKYQMNLDDKLSIKTLRVPGVSWKKYVVKSGSRVIAGPFYTKGEASDTLARIEQDRRKRNPADAAMAVSEELHGRKVKAMIPVQQKRHYHKYLAELGELEKLVVLCRDGRHRVTLKGFDGAMLCSNEDRNQLFIVGGDQSVNLKDFGIKSPHEIETLGEVIAIDYFTDKEHLGSEGGTAVYTHKFRSTNDNGRHKTIRMARNPDLIYYLRDQHLEFSGGSYEIRAEGIDK
jgi:hypothetical protein